MSGLHEVDCSGCGRRHLTNGEQARKERVLRCDCGHFVRLDRALAERHSHHHHHHHAPVEYVSADAEEGEDQDDATHMLSSLGAVTSLSGRGRSRSPQPSLIDDERVSRPVPHIGTPRTVPPSPVSPSAPSASARPRQPSIAAQRKAALVRRPRRNRVGRDDD